MHTVHEIINVNLNQFREIWRFHTEALKKDRSNFSFLIYMTKYIPCGKGQKTLRCISKHLVSLTIYSTLYVVSHFVCLHF